MTECVNIDVRGTASRIFMEAAKARLQNITQNDLLDNLNTDTKDLDELWEIFKNNATGAMRDNAIQQLRDASLNSFHDAAVMGYEFMDNLLKQVDINDIKG